MRPMLNGTWKVPACQGRRSFRLRGFIIGLLVSVSLLLPAAGLLIQSRPTLAAALQGKEPIPAPPPVTLASISAPDDATASVPRLAAPVETPAPQSPPASAAPTATSTRVDPQPRANESKILRLPMRVTAYCPCRRCCGRHSDGRVACGKPIWTNGARFVAAPKWIPFGTRIRIPGYYEGIAVPVLDRGGDIYGHRLDVFFLSHEIARQWGVQYLDVEIEMP
jgi:3D (Asp-Asp-Asp) domain-containing protein